ncbi:MULTISPECIES: two-component system histidine kinase PnpS [Geobacillus]|jgi:two-component system, OmpR family, phosphate regulon sensor histidine kinase PhoR|uniref:histidine kinase n=2 Tax=Geobacillus thermodenitrificans TaxID=33940 RepID=A4IRP6_GEOTN|nr:MULTISPECIES: ATP-binding protein [Geobacillus]ABO68000.1 Sensory box histidine kinase PhoR [Geobacillus thermodenitrificans NG80-2]ARP43747.1 Sensor histidine kinase ResE [Geobacillus thermodenitrificans]ATO38206.1 PAS domain-containing sensor histidine kinase [Geobacillus thermodenitrificans]KQB92295.1 Alkaline phosphatase synthesis sensor protein PhoR [Geobacillus sp. PA-3]MED3716764.1 ATP-binding protein [Geobacillus thermodenitrificans]
MNSFRNRLLFWLVTLIVTVLIALGLLLGQLLKDFYAETMNKRMEKEAKALAILLENEPLERIRLDLKEMGDELSSRITVLDRHQRLQFDSGRIAAISDEDHERIIRTILRKKQFPRFSVIEKANDVYYYIAPYGHGSERGGYVILSTPTSSLKKVSQQIWGVLVSSLGMALIVIVALGWKIANQYMRPIEAATKVAFELEKGNYAARVPDGEYKEAGMLVRSINRLARNLQEMSRAREIQTDRLHTLIENVGSGLLFIDHRGHIHLINRAFQTYFHLDSSDCLYRPYADVLPHRDIIKLIDDIFITETAMRRHMRLTIGIERKHFDVYGAPIIGTNAEWKGIVVVFHDITELKRLEQIRKDFVANVSHELKTPVTSIKGFAETLLDGAMKDEEALEHFLTIILKESERLQTLVEELLDLSKIEQHGFQLQLEDVDVAEVIAEAAAVFRQKAEEKQIDLRVEALPGLVIRGDRNRLKQILINLLANALAYTPEHGQVAVEAEEKEKEVLIHVKDTGIGIEEKEIPRIFERFYRIDKARSRDSGGTGLGLSIVKHLVEAHHGYITVASEVGRGTVFTIHFPKPER